MRFTSGAKFIAANAAPTAVGGIMLNSKPAAKDVGGVRVNGQFTLWAQCADILPRRRIQPDHVAGDLNEKEKE
jgi:hypothetical protein